MSKVSRSECLQHTHTHTLYFCLLLRPGRGAEYCDQSMSVCASVCLSASTSLGPPDRSSRNFCADPRRRGSVLFWRRCDTLCTSGFMDDVAFGRNGLYGGSGVAIPGRSLMSTNALFFDEWHFLQLTATTSFFGFYWVTLWTVRTCWPFYRPIMSSGPPLMPWLHVK